MKCCIKYKAIVHCRAGAVQHLELKELELDFIKFPCINCYTMGHLNV